MTCQYTDICSITYIFIVPAIALMISFGSLSAYTMTTYASLSQQTNAKSISEVWGAIIGNDTKWMADTILLSLCFGCCVFYSAFMGDIFGALSSASGFTGLLGDRSVVLSIVTVLAVLPLCLMEDLSGLAPTAAVGVGGILYTTLFTIKRCFDGTYINAEPYLGTMGQSAQPVFSDKLGLWNFNIGGALVLVNLLGVAFLAHYNAITYYNELENATPERFKKAVYVIVLSCLVLSCLVLSCLVLSCLVLSCLVLSCLVLSCLVRGLIR